MNERPTNNQTSDYLRNKSLEGVYPERQELVEDSNEAYEIAHATKDSEEEFNQRVGGIAASLALNEDGKITDKSFEAYQVNDYSVISNHRRMKEARNTANETGAHVSEAYENGAEYLDLSSDEFTKALAEAPVYRKSAVVKARAAEVGEQVVTVTPDGIEEGRNTAGEGDQVVTGTNGADFILPSEKFTKLYEETEESGVFQSRGMARIIDNPTGKKIGILAPWGEMQYGDADAKLAVQYDPENPEAVGTDRYILDSKEFAAYGLLEDSEV